MYRPLRATALALGLLLLGPLVARADHPGGWPGPPAEDVRAHPPDDPRFDRSEPPEDAYPAGCDLEPSDDVERPVFDCPTIFDEQYELFGFAPSYTETSAFYADGTPQVAGASVDRAWQVTTGHPDATIAIVDTGIRWDESELDTKVFLNRRELPPPAGSLNVDDPHDANHDGAFNVVDYCPATPSRFACPIAFAVDPSDGGPFDDRNGNGRLDGQDLIRAFSDGVDDDANGYVDDIAGWDFFDDDNDPDDVSSHSSSRNHGTGRAEEAGAETDNGEGEAGACPECPLLFLRVWDTFVVPIDHWGQAQVYAADMGAVATENSVGTMGASVFGADATRYAWDRGTLPVVVSSDLNTAHHDYPGNYAPLLWVNGVVTDLEGSDGGVQPRTYFRQANLTQYGGHAHVAMGGDTGSQATGKAAGVAGLVASRGLELAEAGFLDEPLRPAEIKQLITMTAEDVTPDMTVGYGVPDPSQPGWDRYFGYGRIHARAAVDAVGDPSRDLPHRIPPEVLVDDPEWWTLVDPSAEWVDVTGTVAARRSTADGTYIIEVAPGIEPRDGAFLPVSAGTVPAGGSRAGLLGRIPVDVVEALFAASGVLDHSRSPVHPDEFVFTVRVRAVAAAGDGAPVWGDDRRTAFLHRDQDLAEAWPRYLGHGVEQSPKLVDLDDDGSLEIVQPTTNGELHAFDLAGEELPGFPFTARPNELQAAHAGAPGIGELGVRPTPLLTPAVGDVDDDGAPEIVALDGGGTLYVVGRDGTLVRSFRAIDPALSRPELRTSEDAVATGVLAAPVLADLDGDGTLEVVVAALDGRVYAWRYDGSPVDGFPVRLCDPDDPEAPTCTDPKIPTTPAVGDIDGDGVPEIVVGTNEYRDPTVDPFSPDGFGEVLSRIAENVTSVERAVGAPGAFGSAAVDLLGTQGTSSRIYAVNADGTVADGWPVAIDGVLADILPLIGPGFTPALADLDGDGAPEVVSGISTGALYAWNGDGSVHREFSSTDFGPASDAIDRSVALNLFEYPAIGDLTGDGRPEVVKGGVSLNVATNLLLVGQNVPFDHLVQAWDATTGAYLPAYPRRIEDWMILFTPAIADVDGDPAGLPEILMGSGLHLFHAYGAAGPEAAGWPKLTGGWMSGTPAVGDLDGDGNVEVVAGTREGWMFVWRTDGTPSANDEWWTYHHDEHNSGLYGFDPR